eukprot:TRINITY_DN10567_c0_g1_i11.p1 TRINITY_DN10567_c0_g1~~TRINITY_DN10567_c0_g1_i11.p1  ORF type:complete len:293 (-),score=52.85 TRINITY_DN10567_c0_g1_i11:276-1154(-)
MQNISCVNIGVSRDLPSQTQTNPFNNTEAAGTMLAQQQKQKYIQAQFYNQELAQTKHQLRESQVQQQQESFSTPLTGSVVNQSPPKQNFEDIPISQLKGIQNQSTGQYDWNKLNNNKSMYLETKNEFQDAEAENYYEDDFEEFDSGDEHNLDQTRLTTKASEKDLGDVVNAYRKQLESLENYTIFEVIQEEEELMSQQSQANFSKVSMNQSLKIMQSSQVKQIENLKAKCLAQLGDQIYGKVYQFFTIHNKKHSPKPEVYKQLKQVFAKEYISACLDIEQIMFLEADSNSNN